MKLRIEFLGLPGSGKTTIRSALLSQLKMQDSEHYLATEEAFYRMMKGYGDKVYRYILSALPYRTGLKFSKWVQGRSLFQLEAQNDFLANHGLALNAFISSVVFNQMSLEDKKNVIGSFLGMGSLWNVLNHSSLEKSVIFYEEGFVQKSFMFVDHNYSYDLVEDNLQVYLQNVPLPDILIYVKTAVSLSHQRMLERKDGLTKRLKNSNGLAINNFLNSAEEHIVNVKSKLMAQEGCKVIEIVNEGPLVDVIQATLASLAPVFDPYQD